MPGEAILSAVNSEKSLGGQGSAPNPAGELTALPQTSDVVLGQDRSETKKSVLVLEVLSCVVKYNLVTLVVINHNDLGGQSSFSSTSLVSLFCVGTSLLWRSTAAFTYLKVKSTKCLCLLPLVLVLVL